MAKYELKTFPEGGNFQNNSTILMRIVRIVLPKCLRSIQHGILQTIAISVPCDGHTSRDNRITNCQNY